MSTNLDETYGGVRLITSNDWWIWWRSASRCGYRNF